MSTDHEFDNDHKEPWLFFGCLRQSGAGHYIYDEHGNTSSAYRDWSKFDQILCPTSKKLFVPALTRFYGFGYSALAWWDNTGDSRSGSNSIIFAPSLTLSPEDIVRCATKTLSQFVTHFEDLDLQSVNKIYQQTQRAT